MSLTCRLGYTDTRDNSVWSSPCDTVEEGIERAQILLNKPWCPTAWVRDTEGKVVWRGSNEREGMCTTCEGMGRVTVTKRRGDQEYLSTDTCPSCDGMGRLT